jgi:uncharacterized protein (TIGR02996 family)
MSGAAEGRLAEALAVAIDADPDDPAAWAVYGDWLHERGDPRGELIALEQQIRQEGARPALKARIEAIVDAHHREWLGPRTLGAMRSEGSAIGLDVAHGFVTGARVAFTHGWGGVAPEILLAEILAQPSARFLVRLALGLFEVSDNRYGEALQVIAAAGPLHTLRELVVGDTRSDEVEISWTEIGDLSPALGAAPRLQALRAHGGGIRLDGGLAHERLERLVLETGALPAPTAWEVARARCPSLTSLELWFGSPSYGADAAVDDLDALWVTDGLPRLDRLGLRNAAFADALAAAVVQAPLAARVRELDLSMGTLGDRGAEALLAGADRLAHLAVIDVSRSWLSVDAVAALRARFGAALRADDQRGTGGEPYVAVGE